MLPLADEALARRLEGLSDRFMLEWLVGLPVQVERFGEATAAASPERPELDFVNRVYGLWPEDEKHVTEIASFYRSLGLRGWLEPAPAAGFERLAAALMGAGAAPISHHSVLFGAARAAVGGSIRVQRAEDPVLFADLLLSGHEVPEPARVRDRESVERWASIDGWHLFVASLDGSPAGAAILVVDGEIGYLANASTLPASRSRGVQGALIAARIAAAEAAGCTLVCSGAASGSPSQRNLERAGLRIAYTKAVWRFGEPG